MEFLKEHLGEELYNQVAEKLNNTTMKLADLSSGEYVAKGKYEAEVGKNKTLTQNIEELTGKVKTFDGVDLEALKNEAITWQEKYNADMAKLKLDNGIEKALISTKARNMKAVKAMLDLEAIKLDGETITGIDEQLTALRESDGYLFDLEQPKQTTGIKIDNSFTKEDDKSLRSAFGLSND